MSLICWKHWLPGEPGKRNCFRGFRKFKIKLQGEPDSIAEQQ
jgi:hypothetical protein